ncbi:hypothetical protein [Geotalea sp. SG265]|uniref:hypothetical protein n=1 Tax=Geotalea sp. SG265 TaxID=2922867 RepID=UPI001FAFF51B|nr:hypothetical protein [Geotalea sp. SG265]
MDLEPEKFYVGIINSCFEELAEYVEPDSTLVYRCDKAGHLSSQVIQPQLQGRSLSLEVEGYDTFDELPLHILKALADELVEDLKRRSITAGS